MAKKKDRRLIICEDCGSAYPGFRSADGEFKIVGGPACPDCGSSEFVEAEIDM